MSTAAPAAATEPVIRVQQLSKRYEVYERPADRLRQWLWGRWNKRRYGREFWALREASFEVAPGEVLGIVGRNGAGKSTLLQLVCGTLTPTAGTLAVRGRVAALLELGAGFNPEFSGRENVYLAASVLGLKGTEIDARFDAIVEFSGIRDFIEQPVKTYSSGMFMRLAFAVATSVDPDILVIDEALSVGDGRFARRSFDRIMELKRRGKTILFCSHSLYQVEAFCDRVIWLDQGRMRLLGRPEEVVPRYTAFLAEDQASPAATAATAAPAAAAAGAPAGDASTGPASIAASPAEPGAPPPLDGYARFTGIEVSIDGQAGRQLVARPGQNTLSVNVSFESDPKLPAPVVGVMLNYGTLLPVTSLTNLTDGVAIDRDAAGRGNVTLAFPNLALRKGEYLVGVYLGCENALHIYDKAEAFATLNMESPRPEPGLVDLPHHWRGTSTPAKAGS